jgi:hypothetical protein
MAERRAVVIGINTYQDKDAVRPALRGAENDAREIFARFKKFGNFNIDRKEHLLIGEQATCENMRKAISNLFWKKDPCDIAVLYFSGHGFLDDYGNGYIAPWDHIYDDPFVRGIRMQELREYFLANNNKTESLLILDCCHSGVTAEIKRGAPADMPGRFYDSLTSSQPKPLGRGKFILASSGASEKSREMKCAHKIRILDKKLDELEFDDLEPHDHGVMTYFLLEGMNGEAADGDAVRIGNLYRYVRTKVNAYSEDNHKDFKVFDCVCSTYEEGLASQMMLVSASCKSQLSELIRRANACFDETRELPEAEVVVIPASLFSAIRDADSAIRLSPENPEAQDLARLINEKLRQYQTYFDLWITDEKRWIYQRPPYQEVYRPLEEMGELTFEKIQNLDKQQSTLLMCMIRLALGDNVQSMFDSLLKKLSHGKAESRAGMLAAAPAAGGSARNAAS